MDLLFGSSRQPSQTPQSPPSPPLSAEARTSPAVGAIPGNASTELRAPVPRVAMAEVGRLNRRSQVDGTLAGLTAGLLGGIFGQRVLKLDRNKTLLAGLVTGACTGFFMARVFLASYMRQAQRDAEVRTGSLVGKPGSGGARAAAGEQEIVWGAQGHDREAGFGGQEELVDKYATTSGEH